MSIKKALVRLYERAYESFRRCRFNLQYRFEVMTMEETVEHIQKTGCSIARFGDGEFGLITGSRKPSFQDKNDKLAKRLQEVCACKDSRLLVCVPHSFKSTDDCNEFAKKFWDWWIWENNNLEKAAKCLKLSPWRCRRLGDAQITRPYMDWKDKDKTEERFLMLKSLWADQEIIIVEGNQTKIGVGNDLLDNAKSVHRIICPAQNAFNQYDDILEAAQKYGRDRLILLALGPTATVLAYDLALKGYQALDIGHIDIEYEWFQRGAINKVAIPGKYTQEAYENVVEETENAVYLSQIIMRIE